MAADNQARMKKRDVRLLVASVLLALATAAGCWYMNGRIELYRNSIVADERTLVSLENELAVKKAAADAGLSQAAAAAVGADLERKSKDDGVAYMFLERCLTWNGLSEYNADREAVLAEYGISAGSNFAQVFFAPAPYNPDKDELYNCHLVDAKSVIRGIDSDRYSYFSEVTALAGGPGGVLTNIHLVFTYTVDGDGNISNLDAYNAR